MRSALIIAFLLLIAASLIIVGCSDNSRVNGNSDDVWLTSIYPADGAENVSTGTSLYMKFVMPMDTSSVRSNIFLSGGPMMHEWVDSLDHYGGMGHMNVGMRGHMLDWMDSIEIPGQWHWNGNLDSSEFTPDSTLTHGSQYMIMVNEDGVIGHSGHQMHMGHMDEDMHYFYFRTEMYP